MTTDLERARLSELRAELKDIAKRHGREFRLWFENSAVYEDQMPHWFEDEYLDELAYYAYKEKS